MAIFKANVLLRLIFKSQIRQAISVNGFKRNCETSSNNFKNFLNEIDEFDESENRGSWKKGNVRKNDDYDNRQNLNRNSTNFEKNGYESERRSGGFQNRSNTSDRYRRPDMYNRSGNRYQNFESGFTGSDRRSNGYNNNFNKRPSNYYKKRVSNIGKLERGYGTESEWSAKCDVKLHHIPVISETKISEQNVTIECNDLELKTVNRFSEIENLDPRLLEVLISMGHDQMTSIQKHTYDLIDRQLLDILGSAETGSGKTLAFLVPAFNRMLSSYPEKMMKELHNGINQTPFITVLAPTRELVQQIGDEAEKLLQLTPLRICSVIGGVNINQQIDDINCGCHVLVATPGRLMDLLVRRIISLRFCTNLIIDEADRLLDMGFEPQLNSIVFESDMPKNPERHTSMFSATFPADVLVLARRMLQKNFGKVMIGDDAGSRDPSIPRSIVQSFFLCSNMSRMEEVIKFLEGSTRKTILFCNRKIDVMDLERHIQNRNIKVSSLHGDLSQQGRDRALDSFKKNKSRVLIATSIAARGIDVADVECVVNYGTPSNIDEYKHRVGRCGRMGREGEAVTFLTQQEISVLGKDLVHALKNSGQTIPPFISKYQNERRGYRRY